MHLSCAGLYVLGADGSNECPAGFTWIEIEDACRTAARSAGKPAGPAFVGSSPFFPRGCYYSTSDNVAFFNPHAVGAGYSGYQLLCAAVTGAPIRARMGTARGLRGYSRPACLTNDGLHIDTHTYKYAYIHFYIYMHDAGGARRRCPCGLRQRRRTADGLARA